jgi:phage gpG-like protein
MNIEIKVESKNLDAGLAALRGRLEDCSGGMERVGEIVVTHALLAFTNAAERPAEWPPLAASTLRARSRKAKEKGKDGKRKRTARAGTAPLIDSGALARSPRVVAVGKDSVTVGSDRAVENKAGAQHSLAAIHQFGTKDGRIPARPFFPIEGNGLTPDVQKEVLDAFGDWLMER